MVDCGTVDAYPREDLAKARSSYGRCTQGEDGCSASPLPHGLPAPHSALADILKGQTFARSSALFIVTIDRLLRRVAFTPALVHGERHEPDLGDVVMDVEDLRLACL